MSRMRIMLALVCVCAVPALAAAQDDAFKQGLQARGDKKWADVVRHMQNALKADSQESTRKVRSGFLGVQGMEYLPHFFLGEAYLQPAGLRRCSHRVVDLRAAGRGQEQA